MAGTSDGPPPPKALEASVVIVSWNTRDLLLNCLESLERSIGGLPVQIVVVDNGSEDGSAEAVARAHPGVTLVRSEENRGFAAGSNLGLRHSRGEYLILLNSDTIVLPGAIQSLVEYLDRHPDVGAVGGQQLDAEGRFSPSGCWFPNVWMDLSVALGLHRLRFWLLGRDHPLARLFFQTRTGDVDWLSGCFVAVRRRVIDEAGPLPEEFFLYGEDVEWGWRMKQAGWRRVYLHGSPIVHLESRSANLLFPDDRAERMLDGFYTFARRHRHPVGWRIGWLALTGYWGAMAARWTLLAWVRGAEEAKRTARALRGYARRHLDQLLGRVPPIGGDGWRAWERPPSR